jgi:hypothetical protein
MTLDQTARKILNVNHSKTQTPYHNKMSLIVDTIVFFALSLSLSIELLCSRERVQYRTIRARESRKARAISFDSKPAYHATPFAKATGAHQRGK